MTPSSHLLLLNTGVSVAEHHAAAGAGTDKVTAALILPSLCHESVAGIDHSRETGPELLEAGRISIAGVEDYGPGCVTVSAQAMQDRAGKTCHPGKIWVQVQRVEVAVQAVERRLVFRNVI